MISNLDIRKIRSLDGLHYSFEMMDYFYFGLHEKCCAITTNNTAVVGAIASCWGYIDALHRVREVAQSTPSVNVKHPEMRIFLDATSLAEDFRHYIQHLRREIHKGQDNPSPVWGSLSWIDSENENRNHIVMMGSEIPGESHCGCVYDRLEKRWVSKVCLGFSGQAFNFDSIHVSVLRFREFIIPYVIESCSVEIVTRDKFPMVTLDIVAGLIT